jgi:DNA repair exonuclease SbcCD nuclease subunit
MRLIISDTHHHAWTQFAKSEADGTNSRNNEIIKATEELVLLAEAEGCKTMFHAGDLFHTRGSIAPSVFNPVVEYYAALVKRGWDIHLIPGNHDMEANTSGKYTNAVTALQEVGVHVYTEPTFNEKLNTAFIPWIPDLNALRAVLARFNDEADAPFDVVAHSPMNGVITGLPNHGLTTTSLVTITTSRFLRGMKI